MVSSPLACSLLLAFFLCSAEADLINDVCSQAMNHGLCNQVLRSDPNSKQADLRGLGLIALGKGQSATRASIKVAQSVANAKNKAIIDTCVEVFGAAIDNLEDCRSLIKAHDRPNINTLRTQASAALTDIGTCEDEFDDAEAAEPAQLKQASQTAIDIVDILLVVANKL